MSTLHPLVPVPRSHEFVAVFGGGGSDFLAGPWNGNKSQIAKFQAAGYKFVSDNVTLDALGTKDRALGLFHSSTMSVWLDRNVYQATALPSAVQYNGTKGNYRQPGLKAMTLKALDILHARSEAAGGVGFALMSEAASPDKQMHLFDYEVSHDPPLPVVAFEIDRVPSTACSRRGSRARRHRQGYARPSQRSEYPLPPRSVLIGPSSRRRCEF